MIQLFLRLTFRNDATTTVEFATLRSAYTAYETALFDENVISAALTLLDYHVPLATFDHRKAIESDGKKLVYNIVN